MSDYTFIFLSQDSMSDVDRNRYYQKQAADLISNHVKEIDFLITSSLNVHLNLGQTFLINTSQTFVSLETLSIESLKNKAIEQPGSARFEIPSNFTLNISSNASIILRVCFAVINSIVEIRFVSLSLF